MVIPSIIITKNDAHSFADLSNHPALYHGRLDEAAIPAVQWVLIAGHKDELLKPGESRPQELEGIREKGCGDGHMRKPAPTKTSGPILLLLLFSVIVIASCCCRCILVVTTRRRGRSVSVGIWRTSPPSTTLVEPKQSIVDSHFPDPSELLRVAQRQDSPQLRLRGHETVPRAKVQDILVRVEKDPARLLRNAKKELVPTKCFAA